MKSSYWILLLVRRWFITGRNGRVPALSVLPAAGLAVGVAALIVVLGVMNGFQGGYIDSILEVSSFHLRIEGVESTEASALASRLAAIPGVRSAVPFTEQRCLGSSATRSAMVITLRAAPADAFMRDPGMAEALGLSGMEMPEKGAIALGSELARKLDVAIGDMVTLVTVVTDPEEGATTKRASVRVATIFRSGYYEFDSGIALAEFETVATLAPVEAMLHPTLGIKLQNRYDDAKAAARIAGDLASRSLVVESWRSYNRAFFGALRTEKTVMMVLVSLIFLVVGVNIHHAMRRNVAQRTVEIAVIRAMGGRSSDIARVFLLDGVAVGLVGAAFGLLVGLAIVFNINGIFALVESATDAVMGLIARLGGFAKGDYRVFSPRYFYLVEVPVRISLIETAFIALAAILSSSLAAGSAASRLSKLDPAQVLRYE